jgi:hypothetical protein
MRLLSNFFIVLLGVLVVEVMCLANNKDEDKLMLSPFYKGVEAFAFSSHPIAGTARTAVLLKAIEVVIGDARHSDIQEEFYEEHVQRWNATRRRNEAIFLGTNLGLRYLGNKVEDHFHARGYDLTKSITHQFDDYPVLRDYIIKPSLETSIFVGKELAYAIATGDVAERINRNL